MTLYYEEPLVTVRCGHVLEELAAMEPESCQLCLTSPPYYGLRSYQVEPVVWGGNNPGCAHVCGEESQRIMGGGSLGGLHSSLGLKNGTPTMSPATIAQQKDAKQFQSTSGVFCQLCGCWRGHLGLEPRPWCRGSLVGEPCTDQCYLGHLLRVCDGIFRVLRQDGLLVWNMGDSYAGTHVGYETERVRWQHTGNGKYVQTPSQGTRSDLPAKNLLNLPARFSIAMQARGWIFRSRPPWLKRNSMPESVTDRPSVSHEDVYLFAKGPRVYWDAEAVREPHQTRNGLAGNTWHQRKANGAPMRYGFNSQAQAGDYLGQHPNGRNRRTGDWWYESLDEVIADTEAWLAHAKQVRDHGGLLLSPEGEPLGLHVNPQPTKLAHFAAFSPRLVRPFILAATSQVGCCSSCKTPWRRVVQATGGTIGRSWHDHRHDLMAGMSQYDPTTQAGGVGHAKDKNGQPYQRRTLGWAPGCACAGAGVVPCVVLDPFAGTGVTLSVSRSLGRQSVGIDLSAEYCEFMKETLHADLPLFDEEEKAVEPMAQGSQNLLLFEEV